MLTHAAYPALIFTQQTRGHGPLTKLPHNLYRNVWPSRPLIG